MIAKELLIGGGVAIAAVLGLVYASSSAAAPAAGAAAPSFVLKAGHRYEIDLNVPATGQGVQAPVLPTQAAAQAAMNAIASGAFSVAGVGLTYPGTAAPGSAVTVYFLVDVSTTTTVTQAALLVGTPTGTTVTVTDEGASLGSGAAAGGAGSSTSSSTTTPSLPGAAAAASVVGQPSDAQWLTTVTLSGSGSVVVGYWLGDTLEIVLPSGAAWAPGSTAGLPTSGYAPYSAVLSAPPPSLSLSWTWGGGQTFTTALTFVQARTFAPATTLSSYDTVRISLTVAQLTALGAAIAADPAENAAMLASAAALTAQGVNVASMSPAQAFYYFLQVAPWSTRFGASAAGLNVWSAAGAASPTAPATSFPNANLPLPSDWPSSDTTGAMRAEYQYTGPGIAVASLPISLSAWIRTT